MEALVAQVVVVMVVVVVVLVVVVVVVVVMMIWHVIVDGSACTEGPRTSPAHLLYADTTLAAAVQVT